MEKQERLKRVQKIIEGGSIANQAELLAQLRQEGWVVNQSTLSRDLRDLGAVKAGGFYHVERSPSRSAVTGNQLVMDTAGDHLIVLKTAVARGQMVAVAIDQASLPEIVGTLAGDDTIFVAVKGRMQQRRAMKSIAELFKPN